MEERELYIVQSMHPPADQMTEALLGLFKGQEYLTFVRESIRWHHEVIADIAKERGVTHFFCDGVTREHAEQTNKLLEDAFELERTIGWLEKQWQDYGNNHKETSGLDIKTLGQRPAKMRYEFSTYRLKMLRDIQKEILLKMYETEDEGIQRIISSYDLKERGITLQQINDVRDELVHRRIKQTAGERNILFMGIDHKLREFYQKGSEFTVACARLDEKGLEYRYANRDAIPDFFREIVERRYAEMKERTVCL